MKKLSSIGVFSVFKVSLVLGAATGVIYGTLIMISAFMDRQYLVGGVAFVLAPLLMSLVMALANSAMAWVYNRAAERLGGIEVTLED